MLVKCTFFILASCVLVCSGVVYSEEELVVTFRPPADVTDYRFDYEYHVLLLAMEKTRGKYGGFKLERGVGMNFPRAFYTANNNLLKNFVFKTSYSYEYLTNLIYIPIPIDLGIVGYRVCFTSEPLLERIEKMNTLDELRTLTIGQGTLWNDVEILRYNKFRVFEVMEYKNIFPMVVAGRFELFCRGANEVKKEWEEFKNIEGLAIEKSFILAYKLPRFFWTNKNNTKAYERIAEGLKIAYADGSLLKLWEKYNLDSVNFVNLESRKIFWLENPQLKGLAPDYEKYFYFHGK